MNKKKSKYPKQWHFIGCNKCGWFKTSENMIDKCPNCGGKTKHYGTHVNKKY
jgi:rubrerythrin